MKDTRDKYDFNLGRAFDPGSEHRPNHGSGYGGWY